jgi:RNA polymerase sigma-70 factor (ECF subfamily)
MSTSIATRRARHTPWRQRAPAAQKNAPARSFTDRASGTVDGLAGRCDRGSGVAPAIPRSTPAPEGARAVGPDEEQLAWRLIRGDRSAAPEAFRRYAGAVHGVLRGMLGPGPDLDDQVQETFVRFFAKHRAITGPATLRPFLVSIAIRVGREERRRRRVRSWLTLSRDGELPTVAADGDADAGVFARQVYRRLERLDGEDLALFVLRHVEAMELTEVAEAMRMSFSTTRRRLARLDQRLERLFRDTPELLAWRDVRAT